MAKIKTETLRLDIIVDGDKARKALLDQEAAVEENTKALRKLKAEQKALANSGDTTSKKYKSLGKAINQKSKEVAAATEKLEGLRRQQSLTSMTMEELRKRSAELKTALSKAVPGTENYRHLSNGLKQVRSRIKELVHQIAVTDKTFCGFISRSRDIYINIQALYGGLGRLVQWSNQATEKFQQQDEAMTDAMKTTGLTREEIAALNNELKKIDTRTAQNELLSLARIGGKLGITAEADLLQFVSAADKINVALKEDLGGDAEGAIATVGKLVDIFQLEGQFGLEQSLLKVGSAINDLGMASTANEGYIVDFTSRLAGIAPNADISITKILGLGATLDKYGQQAETAGTAIGQTIMAMFKRTETFAEIAKMPLKEFSTLLERDVNEALLRVLEGMNDGGGLSSVVTAMEEMHLNGQRASAILGTLSKNTEELRAQQNLAASAFEKGTSLSEEFATKNTSVTAVIEKQKKAIEEQVVALGEKLMPVTSGALQVSEMGVKLISSLVSVMLKFKGVIIALTAAYAAYNFNNYLLIKYSKEHRAALAEEVLTLNGAKKSTIALSVVKNLLVGNLKSAAKAAKIFFTSLKTGLGPIGWVALAIEGLLAVLSPLFKIWNDQRQINKKLEDSNKALTQSYSEVAIAIDKEKTKLDQLRSAVLSAKTGSAERAAAIRQVNSAYGDYLPALLTERSSNEEVATALTSVNEQLERKLKLQAKEKQLSQINEQLDSQTKDVMDGFVENLEKSIGGDSSPAMRARMNKAVMDYRKGMEEAVNSQQKDKLRSDLFSAYFDMGGDQMWFRGDKLRGLLNNLNTVIDTTNRAKETLDQLYGVEPSGVVGGKQLRPDPNSAVESYEFHSSETKESSIDELRNLIEEGKKVISEANTDKVDSENQRYEAELKRFREHKDDLIAAGVDFQALEMALEAGHQANLSQIDIKAFDDRKSLLDNQYQLNKIQAENRHIEELARAQSEGKDIVALKEAQAKEMADIDMGYALQLQDLLDEIVSMDGTINLDIEGLTVQELTELKQKLEEIKKLRNSLTGEDKTGGLESPSGESEPIANREYSGTMLGLTGEQWEDLFSQGVNGWDRLRLAATAFGEAANDAMKIVSMAMLRQSKLERKALREYERNNDKKKANLERRLNAGLITEAQYNESVKAIDAEYAAYQEQLAIKQAKREKQLSLTQAIINTAMGVTMALATMAPPVNFINAALVAAMGAAEIALIASTPVTTGAEQGGEIFTKRQQDGKVFPARLSPEKRGLISHPTILVGENGAEYVIPNDGLENPTLTPILQTIEYARRSGSLKSLDFRSVFSPVAISPGFINGGYTQDSTGTINSINQQIPTMTDTRYDDILSMLKEIASSVKEPVPAIVSMLGPNGLVKTWERYEKNKKKGQI